MLDDETIGSLLRQLAEVEEGQDRCEKQNEEIKIEVKGMRADFKKVSTQLEELEAKQQADDEARSSIVTVWKVARVAGAIATVVLLPVLGWLGSQAWAHYFVQVNRVSEVETQSDHNQRDIAAHSASRGHEPTRDEVQSNREAIVQINTRLGGIEEEQRSISETQQTILREVRRTRRFGE